MGLDPTIDGLAAEGKKNMTTMSPGTVARLTEVLRRQLAVWVTTGSVPTAQEAARSAQVKRAAATTPILELYSAGPAADI
jgi:hypothetical protein